MQRRPRQDKRTKGNTRLMMSQPHSTWTAAAACKRLLLCGGAKHADPQDGHSPQGSEGEASGWEKRGVLFPGVAAHSPELTLLQQAEGKSEGCLSNLSASGGGGVVSGRCGFTQRIRRGPGACSVEGRITRAGSSWHPQRWSTHPTHTSHAH